MVEVSKNIPSALQRKYPEIPCKQMDGPRNLISHEYFGVDYEMLCEIATVSISQNIKDLQKIIEEQKKISGSDNGLVLIHPPIVNCLKSEALTF
jgi:uncharacterized protein with HEPN domain